MFCDDCLSPSLLMLEMEWEDSINLQSIQSWAALFITFPQRYLVGTTHKWLLVRLLGARVETISSGRVLSLVWYRPVGLHLWTGTWKGCRTYDSHIWRTLIISVACALLIDRIGQPRRREPLQSIPKESLHFCEKHDWQSIHAVTRKQVPNECFCCQSTRFSCFISNCRFKMALNFYNYREA